MKICLFTASFLPQIGGAEFAVHHLAENLTALGHEVVVLAGRERRKSNEIRTSHHYTVRRYHYPPRGLFVNQLLAYLLLEKRRSNFDLLHAHFLYFPGYVAANLKKILKIPVLATAHGEDIQVREDANYGMMLDPVKRKKIQYVLQTVDAVTAISDSIRQDFLNAGVPEEKIFSISHGTDVRSFTKATGNIREMFKIADHLPVLIAVGRNHEKKGFRHLVQAVPLIVAKRPDARLVIIGKGVELLSAQVKALGVAESVILSPPLVGDAYHSLYMQADIYITPSLIEGASLTNLDALGAGLPMIATDVPGNRDFVRDNENGLLIEPRNPQAIADAVLRLLADHELRERLAKASKVMGEAHDWQALTKKYVTLYEKLITESGLK